MTGQTIAEPQTTGPKERSEWSDRSRSERVVATLAAVGVALVTLLLLAPAILEACPEAGTSAPGSRQNDGWHANCRGVKK